MRAANSLAEKIVSTAESQGKYSISFVKAKLLAISLLSYFGSEENITVEGLWNTSVTEADIVEYNNNNP